MGPKQPSFTSLPDLEEAAAITFRRTTWLALDYCLFALQRFIFIPDLTRSSLYWLYARHGISQLPRQTDEPKGKPTFKRHPIGYLKMDICEGICQCSNAAFSHIPITYRCRIQVYQISYSSYPFWQPVSFSSINSGAGS